MLDENGRNKMEWVERDRPLVKVQHVFNVEQTEGLKLRSLAAATPEWGGARARRSRDARQRRADRPCGRRPGLLSPVRGPYRVAGAEPVRVAVGIYSHGAARTGTCDLGIRAG